jgi:hypothetical protein
VPTNSKPPCAPDHGDRDGFPKLIDIDGVQGVGQELQNQMRRKTWCSIGNSLILAPPKGLEVHLQFISQNVNIVRRGVALAGRSSQRRERRRRRRSLAWRPGLSLNSHVYAAVHFIREA